MTSRTPDIGKLKNLMVAKGLSQLQLAIEAQVAKGTVENILYGKVRKCHPKTLARLACVLGCEPGDLLKGQAAPAPPVVTAGTTEPSATVRWLPTPTSYYGSFASQLGPDLEGRDHELSLLDRSWTDPCTHLISLIGIGGLGKSALVKRWLDDSALALRDSFVYVWSFSGQDDCGQTPASEEFLVHLSAYIGYQYQPANDPISQVDRLVAFFRSRPTLLILDGLEVLQNPPGAQAGSVRNDGVLRLIVELTAQNPGLCIITSRISVASIASSLNTTVHELALDPLSTNAGKRLLGKMGVEVAQPGLNQTIAALQGHPLSLVLLGRYLRARLDQPIALGYCPVDISGADNRFGGMVAHVINRYQDWMHNTPGMDIVKLLSLFYAPIPIDVLEQLRRKPVIDGLTNVVANMSDQDFRFELSDLRDLGLATISIPHDGDGQPLIELHPLLRSHFQSHLKNINRSVWRKAHGYVYDIVTVQFPDNPTSYDALLPFYRGIYHGCQAGKFQEVFEQIIWAKIFKGYAAFSFHAFGCSQFDTMAVAAFFQAAKPGVDSLPPNLTPAVQAEALWWAGLVTRSQGRVGLSIDLLQASLTLFAQVGDAEGLAVGWGFLSRSYLQRGDLVRSEDAARRCVAIVRLSKNPSHIKLAVGNLASILYFCGRLEESLTAYEEGEQLVNTRKDAELILQMQATEYTNALLDSKRFEQAQAQIAALSGIELGMPMQRLMTAYVKLRLAQQRRDDEALIEFSIDELARLAGNQKDRTIVDYYIRCLTLLSHHYAHNGDLEKAGTMLDDVSNLIDSSEMNLVTVDYLLARVDYQLMAGQFQQAQNNLRIAAHRIEQMGYHLMDAKWQRLQTMLADALPNEDTTLPASVF